MKPRDILNKSKKIYFLVVGTSFFTLAMAGWLEKLIPHTWFKILSLGSGTIFAVGVLLVYVGIKCPKCNKILGLKFVFAEETLTRCPRCGINFDEDTL